MLMLVGFGMWSLPQLNKDEFPQFTIRQGVVAAIYPGATTQEVEQQVTAPLENFLFSYEEIDKEKTYSVTKDGIVYIYAMLNLSVEDKDEVWSKIRDGISLFKTTSLPQGVLQVVVIDDFGATSSVLLAIESDERSPRELEAYSKQICSYLRTIPEMGKLKVMGQQSEEIAVEIDLNMLSRYGIDSKTLFADLALQGFRIVNSSLGKNANFATIQVEVPYLTEYEIGEQVVYTNPIDGSILRLKDIATITRRYPKNTKRVNHYEGDQTSNCVIISMEMLPGNNIVEFGKKVDKALSEVSSVLPPDVKQHRITDQPKVVNKSVMSFLRDVLFSVIVVIMVMLVLFPLKTAIVAGLGVPVCAIITFGLMYLTGIELNTVTLAALIVVLGMIVDDAVIVVDGYTNTLKQGKDPWYAATANTKELFMPMLVATLSISGMFFPMTKIINGPLGEFVQLFPWTIFFALGTSILYATYITPYLATQFIKGKQEKQTFFERMQNKLFVALENIYEKTLRWCFHNPKTLMLCVISLVGLGVFLFTRLNVQLMPKAERNCFAVEIHLREGSSIAETSVISDSIAKVLIADDRVKSVTSFIGQSSPRFHATYSPQLPCKEYAQYIVNTVSEKATEQILKEYTPKYENMFPNAYIRFKQMDYQAVANPIEVYVKADEFEQMEPIAEQIQDYMSQMPELRWVHSNYDQYKEQVKITLKEDEAERLGITQSMLSVYLSSVFSGQQLTTVWEKDYAIPVMLYAADTDSIDYSSLGDLLVPTITPGVWVTLSQVADISPSWHHAEIGRRNSVRTITIGADLNEGISQPQAQKVIEKWIRHNLADLPQGVRIEYGGLNVANKETMPQIILSVIAALLVMFFVLLYHFEKISLSLLTLSASILCIFGAFLGLYIFGLDFSITAVLGVVSLIGIIVRNAIMMYEYAEQLRKQNDITVRQAAFDAGIRRMRPVFLTSATTALGVIPMIVAHTSLWMPMGVVICFGTIFTLPLAITALPVMYWLAYKHEDKQLLPTIAQ